MPISIKKVGELKNCFSCKKELKDYAVSNGARFETCVDCAAKELGVDLIPGSNEQGKEWWEDEMWHEYDFTETLGHGYMSYDRANMTEIERFAKSIVAQAEKMGREKLAKEIKERIADAIILGAQEDRGYDAGSTQSYWKGHIEANQDAYDAVAELIDSLLNESK